MDVLRPLVHGQQLEEHWLRVASWIDEASHDLDDLDTLGTDNRSPQREVR